MNIIRSVSALLLAYLAGSVPTSVWAGRLFHGIDVREHGSGNAGATNTIRVLGWKTGIPVLLIDMGKGLLAAMLPKILHAAPPGSDIMLALMIVTGTAAIVGHVYPVYVGFRGGKGVATTFGVLMALQPWLTLTCAGVFLIVLLITGYVSLGSITAGIMFPVLLFTLFRTQSLLLQIFAVVIAIGLILTHSANIGRLMRGEEKKFLKRKQS